MEYVLLLDRSNFGKFYLLIKTLADPINPFQEDPFSQRDGSYLLFHRRILSLHVTFPDSIRFLLLGVPDMSASLLGTFLFKFQAYSFIQE